MKVSPFTYAKLFLGRYRSQVLMVILGLTMIIVGLKRDCSLRCATISMVRQYRQNIPLLTPSR